jgi:hypothetical protein
MKFENYHHLHTQYLFLKAEAAVMAQKGSEIENKLKIAKKALEDINNYLNDSDWRRQIAQNALEQIK